MFSSGPAQHALGRPQDRRSAAGSSASRGLLQGAACPPSLAELIFMSSLRCMLVVHQANPSFPHVFRFSRRRLESVCVCVCVCSGMVVGIRTDRIRLFLWTACHKSVSSRQNEYTWSNVAVRSFDSRSGICVGVLLWVVVCAPTGPGASFSETPFF